MSELSAAIQPARTAEDRFVLHVPDGWQQGRGAFGGFVFGALLNAMSACETDAARLPRSFTAEIAGPVLPGEAELRVSALRRGTGLSTWNVALSQGGEVLARATGVFGRSRADARRWAPERPAPPDWQTLDLVPIGPPMGPAFAQHFEFRSTGPLPFSEGQEAETAGWIRPRTPLARAGPAELVTCVDAWWPTLFSLESGPRPMATVSFTAQLYPPKAPFVASHPLFHRARGAAAADGYVLEQRELWSEAGELLVSNQQTFVVIK